MKKLGARRANSSTCFVSILSNNPSAQQAYKDLEALFDADRKGEGSEDNV